ncbi:MAG TPA: hypothetical protein VF177_11790, partial [Anaerolineae bacterium]
PEPEFWGETRHSQGRILTLIYPQRDEMIARRLALDIDAKLMEMCAALAELECLEDLRVSSALTTDPGSLNEATLANTLVRAGETLELPAPTLVGTPVDEAAYQALYRGYATHVVAAAITDLVGWRCCGQAHFYQALLAQQLRRLALRPLPLTSGDYEALTQLNLEELADTWSGTDILEQIDGAKPHLALAQFLIEESGASATTMQRVLAQVNSASEAAYWGWLFQFAGGENSNREALEREWFRFVYNRSTTAQTPPPLPWPEQDLQLLCRPVTGQTLALYRYDLVADSLTFATTLERPVAFMIGLTDDRGVVVGEYQSAGARESLYLWENGVKKRILWDSSASVPVALPVTTDPEGRLLLMYSPLEASTPAGLLPLADCRAGADCALTVLNGFPIWSPAGERAVIVVGDLAFTSGGRLQGNLFLSDGNGEDSHFLGLGATPFWLDNETFGFVTLDPELLRQSIYTVTVGNATVEPTLLLAVDELAAVLPESQESGSLHLDYVAVTPTDPDLLLIASADPSGQASGGYLFTFDRETEKVSLHLEIEDEPRLYQRGYRFSPDGRWLLISSLNNVDPIWVLYLHNVEGGDTLTFTVNDTYPLPLHWYTDWSADNQWLSLPERGHVRLIAPDHDYEHLVIPEDRVCSGAVWVNKE